MSTILYRVGKVAYARSWWVIAGWMLVCLALAGVLMASPPRLTSQVRIDGTQAQNVIDDLARRLPAASGGQGIIAFQTPSGTRIDQGARQAAVMRAIDRIYGMPHVIDVRKMMAAEVAKGTASPVLATAGAIAAGQSSPGSGAESAAAGRPVPLVVGGRPVPGVIVSADRSVALMQFQFDAQSFELPQGTIDDVITAAQDTVRGQGIAVLPSSTMIQLPEVFGIGEAVGVGVAAIVLVMALGSVTAAGLPLVTALVGVGVGVGGAFAMSHLIHIHSMAVVLALMLGLAVGMDYALFIVNRQRRLVLDRGLSAHEAAARAVGTAGSAVFFAGTTVVIALVALTVVQIRLLTVMALIAAGTVAVAVLVSLTLLPALLGVIGEHVVRTRARTRTRASSGDRPVGTDPAGTDPTAGHRIASAWGTVVVRHRYLAGLLVVVLTTVIAVPALGMSLGLPSGAAYNTGTAQRSSYDVVARHLGTGYNGPLLLVVTPTPGATRLSPADVAGLHRELSATKGVAAVDLAGMDPTGATAILTVTPTSGPTDSATAGLVHRLRDRAPALAAAHHVTVGITGFAALAIDVSQRLHDVLPLYIAVVLVLSLLLLLLVFRSIIVPIKATAGFLLSILATLGATTAVFQWGWLQTLLGVDATSPVLSFLPIVVTGVLYGLAMDYEVFLVSSVKEAHVHGHQGHGAITHGFNQAGRVVVAAAVIMTAVFAGFVANPDPMIKQVGFALAAGVLIDAFLIRVTLVPAVMAIVGDTAWWLPRFLRRLPDLDIEGDRLTAALHREATTTTAEAAALQHHP